MENTYMKLISGNENLILDEKRRKEKFEVIYEAKDMFSCIWPEFKKYCEHDLMQDDKFHFFHATLPAIPVQVHEINDITRFNKRDNYWDIIYDGALNQHQIINFVRKYRDWLASDDHHQETLFFLRSWMNVLGIQHYLVRVRNTQSGLYIQLEMLSRDIYVEEGSRLVVLLAPPDAGK